MLIIKKHILIVEDNYLIGLANQRMIQSWGYDVCTASSPETALSAVQNDKIDLILMDIDLNSTVNGISLATSILETKVIPILFFSSAADPGILAMATRIAQRGVVDKNCDIDILKDIIDAILVSERSC